MKIQRMFLLLFASLLVSINAGGQTNGRQIFPHFKLYQQMTQTERATFVASESRLIARRLSGKEYNFTPAFEAEIAKSIEFYANRIGNNQGDELRKDDMRLVFERGLTHAPTLAKAFRANNLSPLYGLYIPLIESEYVNVKTPNSVGAIGMFQFLPKTGQRYGLTTDELLDVEKSADAAARYITNSLDVFKDDAMKEVLALLSYNRGTTGVRRDLQQIINDQNKRCSICALTAASETLDETFQIENVFYVPRFFAAAIIGENPATFALNMQPLSSYENRN